MSLPPVLGRLADQARSRAGAAVVPGARNRLRHLDRLPGGGAGPQRHRWPDQPRRRRHHQARAAGSRAARARRPRRAGPRPDRGDPGLSLRTSGADRLRPTRRRPHRGGHGRGVRRDRPRALRRRDRGLRRRQLDRRHATRLAHDRRPGPSLGDGDPAAPRDRDRRRGAVKPGAHIPRSPGCNLIH